MRTFQTLSSFTVLPGRFCACQMSNRLILNQSRVVICRLNWIICKLQHIEPASSCADKTIIIIFSQNSLRYIQTKNKDKMIVHSAMMVRDITMYCFQNIQCSCNRLQCTINFTRPLLLLLLFLLQFILFCGVTVCKCAFMTWAGVRAAESDSMMMWPR